MNVPAAISLAAAVVGLGVGGIAFGVGSSPRWARYRLLSVIALLAAVFCGLDVMATVDLRPEVLVALARVQNAAGAILVVGWQIYADRQLRQRPTGAGLLGRMSVALIGAGWFLPGVFLDGSITRYPVTALGITFQYANPTPLGIAAFALELGYLAVPFARFVRGARDGIDGARGHAVALGLGLVGAAYDTVVATGAIPGPFLLSVSLIGSVCAVGFNLTRAFIADARELDDLTQRLEQLVEERTKELVATECALMRAEKLAAIGQLSAGVAHEINNPAAAVAGNLEYLREELRGQVLEAETVACIDDSLDAIDRIAKIVRRLLDVGRTAAAAPAGEEGTSVALAVEHAIATARATLSSAPVVSSDIAEGLFVSGPGASVVKVLVELIVNAGEAIDGAPGGRIAVVATTAGADVVISVTDNGPGMSEETKRRLFEPFYTTKPFGRGMGLGLPRSLGIVRSLGGDVLVDARPGETTMRIRLPAASRPVTAGARSEDKLLDCDARR